MAQKALERVLFVADNLINSIYKKSGNPWVILFVHGGFLF